MLTNDQLLRDLAEHVSPADLPSLIRRLLRVPEVWEGLRHPDILGALAVDHEIRSLLPGTVAAYSLGLPSLAAAVTLPSTRTALTPLQVTATRAFQLVQDAPHKTTTFATMLLGNPAAWRSPLACAWPYLPEPTALLRHLIPHDVGLLLAANALLANWLPDEAARWLQGAVGIDRRLLSRLVFLGEASWVSALNELQSSVSEVAEPMQPSDRLDQARCLRACGKADLARQELQRAWNETQNLAATIADELAGLAQNESDPVTALVATKQALSTAGTPERRAAAANSLITMKRPEEALALLPPNPTSPEEQIALGLALLEIGDVATGTAHLASIPEPALAALPMPWLENLAQALERVGRMEDALRTASALVERAPISADVRLLHARLLLASGHNSEAVSQASLALALDPQSVQARHTLATALQATGRSQEAIPHWKVLATQDGRRNLDLARCSLEAGDPDTAHQALDQVFAAGDAPAAAHALLAELFLHEGRADDARAQLEQASATSPHEPDLWIALSRILSAQGQHDAAGRVLQSAVQHAPDSGALHAALARWHRSCNELCLAEQAIGAALRIDPSRPDWLLERGELLCLLGRHQEALPILTDALGRVPGSARARLALARCYDDLGEPGAAAQVVSKIRDDLDFQGHLLLGRVYTRAARSEPHVASSAKVHLEKALADEPNDAQVHFWLGELNNLMGDVPAALRAYSRAAELASEAEPSFQQQVILGLGQSALAAGDTSLALRVLEEGRQRFADSLPYLTALSQAYRAAGRGLQALDVAQQALAVEPDSPLALRTLAEVAASLGKWEEALCAHQKLTQLQASLPDAWLELAKVAHSAQQVPLARSALARALLVSRGKPTALAATAEVLAQLGWLRTAQTALQNALSRSPDDVSLLRRLAEVADGRTDSLTAHRAWTALAAAAPDDVAVLRRAAELSWSVGKRTSAIGFLQRAVSLEPDDIPLRLSLARALRDNGEFQLSLQQFGLLLEQRSGDVDLNFEAASVAVEQGAFAASLPWLERAHAAAPARSDIATLLAECMFRVGRMTECRQVLESLSTSARLNARGAALLALARASSVGIAPALEAFRQALTLPMPTPADVAWVADAALRLGQWSDAIRLYRLSVASSGPLEKGQAMLRLIDAQLHSLEAGWLLRSAEALGHTPQGIRPEEVAADIHRATEERAPDSELRALRARLDCLTLSRDDVPEDAPALAAVIYHLRRGRPETALQSLHPPTENKAATCWLHLALGLAHEALSDGAKARGEFERAAADLYLQPVSSFLIGRTYHVEGDLERAIQAFNAAVAGWPDEALWHHRLATLYLAADNLPTALPHLQQAAELAPENPSIALSLGRALRLDGQLSEAKTAYATALPSFPTDAVVWREAAELALAVGDAQSAEIWFDRACTLAPSDARCLIGSARAAAALGKARLAIDRAQAAARLSPADPDVLLGLGEILARQGKAEKALQAYDQALAHGNRLIITLARSRLLVQMGRAREAAQDLKHLLEAHPESDVAWAALAAACAAAHHPDEALQAAGRAVRLAPRKVCHRLLLSRLCRDSGQLDRALKEVKEAQALQPTDATVWLELGLVYAARQEPHQALEAFQQAISLDPSLAAPHFQAGLVYKQLKAYSHASRMFRRAVELDPKDAEAFHQLAAVNALELVHGGLAHAAVSR